MPNQLRSERTLGPSDLKELRYTDLPGTVVELDETDRLTISLIEDIIDEEENGLMLPEIGKRTATMILVDQSINLSEIENSKKKPDAGYQSPPKFGRFSGNPNKMPVKRIDSNKYIESESDDLESDAESAT